MKKGLKNYPGNDFYEFERNYESSPVKSFLGELRGNCAYYSGGYGFNPGARKIIS
jgi:hypothetical protein